MAPREAQHQHMSDVRRNEELRLPTGYISEEMISPVSLLRSDRFVRSGLKDPPPSQGQISEQADVLPDVFYPDARPRIGYQGEQATAQEDFHNNTLHGRRNTAQRVRAKAKNNHVMQWGRTYPPAQRLDFDGCYQKFRHVKFGETKQSSNNSFRAQMHQSPLDNARTSDEDIQDNFDTCPYTTNRARPPSTSEQKLLQPDPPFSLAADPDRALLSQSPIRPTSAPSSSHQFQPSPLKSRPMTATTRRSSQMESESSNFDNQLHDHIRAFQAQQELSRPGNRISNSPLTNRQGSASEDWAESQKLPDPSMVKQSQRSVDLNNLTLNSTER